MRIPSRVYNSPDVASRADRANRGSDTKKSESGSSAKSGVDADGVKVSISSQAKRVADDNAMDVEKIERLRAVINSGEFEMNFELIGERIVESGG